MNRIANIIDVISVISKAESAAEIFQQVENKLKDIGSQHHLITGIPLPGKKIDQCILVNKWKEANTGKINIPIASDVIFQKSTDWHTSFILRRRFHATSGLARATGVRGNNLEILIIPVITNFSYQGVLVTTFKRDESHQDSLSENSMSFAERSVFSCLVSVMFHRLHEKNILCLQRTGELTAREKEVLSLSALGETSAKVSEKLGIRERTVIAHLQNASSKLGAKNRTECVLQGIRYNQIGPGAGLGFFQIETEGIGEESRRSAEESGHGIFDSVTPSQPRRKSRKIH